MTELTNDFDYNIESLSRGDAQFLNERLVEFNASKVPFTQSEPFVFISYGIRGNDKELLGGITALLYCWQCPYNVGPPIALAVEDAVAPRAHLERPRSLYASPTPARYHPGARDG
jgi:hypothetical protein